MREAARERPRAIDLDLERDIERRRVLAIYI
jgi:hypothetical protein